MFKRLVEEGYLNMHKLILREQQQLGLTADEVVVLSALISSIEKKKNTVSITALAKSTGYPISKTGDLFTQLLSQGMITTELELKSDGKEKEVVSIQPLFEKVVQIFEKSKETKVVTDQSIIVNKIETAFGKPLSPNDIEIIKEWFTEKKTLANMEASLQIALEHHKKSVSYVDRILRSESVPKQKLDEARSTALDQLLRGKK